jgi:cholesterol oxidase
MTGCRYNVNNTLVKHYLYLAERAGARVCLLTTVVSVRPAPDGYVLSTRGTDRRPRRQTFEAEQVMFAAGALGTQRLLHRMRASGAERAVPVRAPVVGATVSALVRQSVDNSVPRVAPAGISPDGASVGSGPSAAD